MIDEREFGTIDRIIHNDQTFATSLEQDANQASKLFEYAGSGMYKQGRIYDLMSTDEIKTEWMQDIA